MGSGELSEGGVTTQADMRSDQRISPPLV